MSGKPKVFDAKDFMQRLAAFVRQNPDLATRAYARAAATMREIARDPKNSRQRLQFEALAVRLDQLSAEAGVPEADPEYLEEIHLFTDAPDSPAPIVTEYDALVSDIAESKVGPDGSPNSEIAAAAVFQQIQEERESAIAPPVQMTPASAKPGLTLFGNQALVQYSGSASSGTFMGTGGVSGPVTAEPEAQVVRWDGREQETMLCTIAVGRVTSAAGATFPASVQTSSPAVNYNYRPYFRVMWGTSRAQPCEAYGDVGRGCQFTVAASYLYVNVGMAAPPPVSGGLTTYAPGSMMLFGTMGFFASGRNTPVLRTVFVDRIAGAGGSQTIVIPLFATTVECIVAQTPASFSFSVQTVDGTQLATLNTASPQLQSTLSDDAYQIVVSNNGVAVDSCEIVFGLSL